MKHRDRDRPQTRTARNNRKTMTYAEVLLWQELRGGKLGARFRRQEPIGPYIVDFTCTTHKIVIEADGAFHSEDHVDGERDAYLRSLGYRILRFWNDDILISTDVVADFIRQAVEGAPFDGRFPFED